MGDWRALLNGLRVFGRLGIRFTVVNGIDRE